MSKTARFTCIVIFIALFSLGNYFIYKSYYRTIYHVETTEMNMYFHTLPSKLSILLKKGMHGELKRVINSNYGFFGIVVTDCTKKKESCETQKILAQTSPNNGSKLASNLKPTDLKNYEYDLLSDPPPEGTKNYFKHAYDKSINKYNYMPDGKIIGRIYYIRNQQPNFIESLQFWLKNPFKLDRTNKYYLVMTIASALFTIVMAFIMKIRMIKKNHQIAIKEREKAELERRVNETQKRYESQLYDKHNEIYNKNKLLDELCNNLKERDNQIIYFEEQIQKLNDEGYEQLEVNELLSKQLESMKHEKDELVKRINDETSSLTIDQEEESKLYNEYNELMEKYKEKTNEVQYYEYLQSELVKKNKNQFELKLYEYVGVLSKVKTGDWIVITEFDASRGYGSTREIDLAVITNQCVIAIEAKSWHGRIITEGDTLNTNWLCCNETNEKGRVIHSSGWINPHKQVKAYVSALKSILDGKYPFTMFAYGVVVFPKGTNVSELGVELKPGVNRLSEYHYVTVEEGLVDTLEIIHNDARFKQREKVKRPAPSQIYNILYGIQKAS